MTCIKSVLLFFLSILSYIHNLLICPLKLNVLYFCLLTHAAAVLSGIQICSWFVLLLFLSCFFRRINLVSDLSNIFTSLWFFLLMFPSWAFCLLNRVSVLFSILLLLDSSYFCSVLLLSPYKPCIRPLQYFTSWYVLLLFLSCSILRINRVSVLFSILLLLDTSYFCFCPAPFSV